MNADRKNLPRRHRRCERTLWKRLPAEDIRFAGTVLELAVELALIRVSLVFMHAAKSTFLSLAKVYALLTP